MPPTAEDSEQHSIIQHGEAAGQNNDSGSNDRLRVDNDCHMEDNDSTSGEDEYICKLSNDLQEIAKNDLDEKAQIRDESLQSLRSWIKSQPHLKNIRRDANFLLRFLRMQKYIIPKTTMVLDKYIKMRVEHPNWFQNLNIHDEAIRELVTNGYLFVLQERDQNGRKVIFSVAKNLDPHRHTNSDAMRAHLITFEALLEDEENQIKGLTYIFDCQGLSLSHLKIWTPSEVANMFSCCEKNLPMRHQKINLISLPFGIWAVFEFAKSLLSEKIRRRFSVHSDISRLQKSIGDYSFLPAEYGGNIPLKHQAAKWVQHLEANSSTLLGLDKMTVDGKSEKKTKERKSSIFEWF